MASDTRALTITIDEYGQAWCRESDSHTQHGRSHQFPILSRCWYVFAWVQRAQTPNGVWVELIACWRIWSRSDHLRFELPSIGEGLDTIDGIGSETCIAWIRGKLKRHALSYSQETYKWKNVLPISFLIIISSSVDFYIGLTARRWPLNTINQPTDRNHWKHWIG